MSESQGKFVWYDLMAFDTKAAETFYSKVVGWEASDAHIPTAPYTLFSMGDSMICGVMGTPETVRASGARPHWMGYIGVLDVDASAARVTEAGGSIDRAPENIPGIGRFAVAKDPQGAGFILFQPNQQAPNGVAVGFTPGRFSWHELHTDDVEAAFAFYSSLFGWTKGEAIDMGPAGIYQMFNTPGSSGGGMMKRQPGSLSPHPFWLYYVNAESIDAAAERVKAAGGEIIAGPHQVPGGSWILQCRDSQAAMFALVAPDR